MKLYSLVILLFLISGILEAQVSLESAQRMAVDARYDSLADASMNQVLRVYHERLDQEVSRVIGQCPRVMTSGAPESKLSNFLADQLLAKARELSSQPVDMAVLNFGGIRAPINAGPVTIKDLYKVMPFENQLVILTLKGSDVQLLFQSIALGGGEAVSGITLEIKDKSVNKLLIGGELPDEAKLYRIATMDYLAEGNSGMTAFLNAVEKADTGLRVRDCYIQQIEQRTAKGEAISANLDGRIKWIQE